MSIREQCKKEIVLTALAFCAALLICCGNAQASAADLPATSQKTPVELTYFPTKVHALVWRNWGLVPADRLATVVKTTPEKIKDLAESMGLPRDTQVPPEMAKRGYITIIRRNWHLLPYEQLEQLLDITPEQLAFTLREDDFLYIKLGSIKPQCELVQYTEPSSKIRERAAEIKHLVKQQFGDQLKHPSEPRFSFVSKLSELPASKANLVLENAQTLNNNQPRFLYSYFALYGDPLSDPALDPYPDGLLARLKEVGVNGVWLHVVLRQLAPGGPDFPEWGDGWELRLANLRKIVARAEHYGIDVYLYMNEPRAMPKAFFANRPDMEGVTEDGYSAVCTSNPKVRKWLSDSLAHVFREVPGLGGIFTISASENLTNCASHNHQDQCPRCKLRTDADIIAEVNSAMEEGVHRSAPNAKVIAWDWGWKGHGDASEIITKLPTSTWLMSVSEWATPIERGGIKTQVGEYSMSAIGPGPHALAHWQVAREKGLKTVAKVQFNNTWELSSVPYLPVMDLVAEHCSQLAKVGVDGLMLSWSVGGYPSPNLELANEIFQHQSPNVETALQSVAERHFGKDAATKVRQAWTKFSRAFQEFPFQLAVLYDGPQQMGPANLLYSAPTKYAATMSGLPYDDLKSWRGDYPPEVFAAQFRKVGDGWGEGLVDLAAAQSLVPEKLRESATADFRVAQAAQIHFASTANQAQFVIVRDQLSAEKDPDKQKELRQQLVTLLDDEIRLATQLYRLASEDSRIGFEASNQYFYVPLDLVEKVINCTQLRELYVNAK